ncbi:hypothetical protein GIB67_022810, partial [Kingdonia uniflora]
RLVKILLIFSNRIHGIYSKLSYKEALLNEDLIMAKFENGHASVNGSIGQSDTRESTNAKQMGDLVEWLNDMVPSLRFPLEASEEELRASLIDGTALCIILNRVFPGSIDEASISGRPSENLKRFLAAMDQMGLPVFKLSDLEKGSLTAVFECISALQAQFSFSFGGNNPVPSSIIMNKLKVSEVERLDGFNGSQQSLSGEDRRKNSADSKFQRVLRSPVMSEPSAALIHHVGHKFHEVFQLKQGRYADLPAAKISEMMKSTSLDNAPTQSLLSVVNGILDESIDKKNGEIPHRVACLLRKVVQEIERRISTQAEHIRTQNNLYKIREEKYQSRLKVLETLATGTSEETELVMSKLQQIKTEKTKIEERKKLEEQDVLRLTKEKDHNNQEISTLKQELDITKKTYEQQCLQLETRGKETQAELEERLKELEYLLNNSREKEKEREAFSEAKAQRWSKKELRYQGFLNIQSQALQELKVSSESIKQEIVIAHTSYSEEFNRLGVKLKGLADAAENYNTVLEENRRLYNEVQDLKGNIRVYCRIRPFLPGQNKKQTTIEYIGENGELVVANPSKQGKESHRLFKFNKVFGPAATQGFNFILLNFSLCFVLFILYFNLELSLYAYDEVRNERKQVFLDTQPLIRSVLDGYNVCIFAYGQTGSGKTYTMSGPSASSKEDWGVNYRALNDLFHISQTRRTSFIYEVGVQMVEIYNEQVRDLLTNDGSQKRYPFIQYFAFFNLHTLGILTNSQPNGLAVPDASMHPVNSTSDVLDLMQTGLMNRAVGATALNERSSRSHSVLTVHVRGSDLETGAALRGSLHLVDLAGSERVDRSEVTGDRLKEAQHINKSLSALGDVIFALAQKSPHVPYRNSKLTQVLQSSLGGQAKTLMFVQLNPDVESYSESVSTLKFAERVSGVELGAARSNKEGRDVRELMEQVASLKDTIAKRDEEIERLQTLKDFRTGSPSINGEKRGISSFRQGSASPKRHSLGGVPQQGRRLSVGKGSGLSEKAVSDPDNCSEYSDKHSDTGSQQSLDDFKHHKEFFKQSKLAAAEEATQNFNVDDELLGFGDGDSEERLSDISDSGLSMGTETDGSISSVVEFTLFPEGSKPAESTTEKAKAGTKIPRPPPKHGLSTMSRASAVKDSSKLSTSSRKTTTAGSSSLKTSSISSSIKVASSSSAVKPSFNSSATKAASTKRWN